MNPFGMLLAPLVATIAVAPAFVVMFLNHNQEKKFLREQLSREQKRSQQMLNVMLSKDLPTLAGLNQTQSFSSQSASEEYIPRDDMSEAARIQARMPKGMVQFDGYGDVIFEEDPELATAISELTRGGHFVDLGEG